MTPLFRVFNIVSVMAIATVVSSAPSYALSWNDAGVTPVQNSAGRWIDATSKKYISTAGMPGATQAAAAGTAGNAATGAAGTAGNAAAGAAGATKEAADVAKKSTSLANKTAKGVSNAKANWSKMSRRGKMLRGLAVLGGGFMVYEATVGNGPHSWMDVISAAGGGATVGVTIGTPFGGVGGLIGGAVGAVGGAAVGGAKFFSESGGDCVYDEIMPNVYTCCATVFNKGARYVDIGGTMLCEMSDGNPGVKTCLNGDSTTTHNIFKNDHWSECQAPDSMWCPGVEKPAGDEGILYMPTLRDLPESAAKKSKIVKDTDENQISEKDLRNVKVCWDWVCDDTAGYVKQGNVCSKEMEPAPSTDESTVDGMINRLEQIRADIIKDCGTLGQ